VSTNPFWDSIEPDLYGPLVATGDVRLAMRDFLTLWLPGYLTELNTRRALDPPLQQVQDWTVRPEYRSLPQTESPAIMVTAGQVMNPQREGDGSYRAHFPVRADVVLWGGDWEPTEDLCGLYSLAVVAAVVQHPSLPVTVGQHGPAHSTRWVGTRYVEVEHSSTRTLGVAQISFDVEMDDVVSTVAGPDTPGADPVLPPLVETIVVTVNKEQD